MCTYPSLDGMSIRKEENDDSAPHSWTSTIMFSQTLPPTQSSEPDFWGREPMPNMTGHPDNTCWAGHKTHRAEVFTLIYIRRSGVLKTLCNLQTRKRRRKKKKKDKSFRTWWNVGTAWKDTHWCDFRGREPYNQQLNYMKLFLYFCNLIAHKSILIRFKNYWTCTSMSCQVLSDNVNFTWDQC